MINRKNLTLEARIARLENLVKSNSRKSATFESFESSADEAGARAEADRLAAQMSRIIGYELTLDDNQDYIASYESGWSSDPDAINEEGAFYMFSYNVVGVPGCPFVTCYIRPSNKRVGIWMTAENKYNAEGLVDPRTGICEWSDEPEEELLPLSAWRGFSFDILTSDDDYDESCKRRHRASRNESTRKPVRRYRR